MTISPDLIWGLFPRLLALVYLIATASLFTQVLPLAGSQGLRPVKRQLEKIKQDYPTFKRFFYFPTLLWINAEDWFIRTLIVVGCGSALLIVYGSPFTWLCFLVCWIVYLSLDVVVGFAYPWDSLLLEASFLAIFLPAVHPLTTAITAVALPLPAVAFAYRLLIFRLMFGFGKFKFTGSNLKERLYLKPFMINQPIPSPVGWWTSRLPGWIMMVGLTYLFLVEIVLPFFIFFGGGFRLMAALGIVGLMIGIQLCGNFGFFNLLVISLCVTLLDTQASLFQQSIPAIFSSWNSIMIHAVMLLLYAGGLVYLPFNSWCTQAWMYWPSLVQAKQKWVRTLVAFFRGVTPFRIIHSYGVFPPTSSPPLKWVTLIEGSNDGVTWQAYHYRFMPSSPDSPPQFIAPYHPRLDHNIFYEAYGTNLANFTESTFGIGNPYNFAHLSGVGAIVQKLLEGNRTVLSLFGHNPFPDAPPRTIRVSCYTLEATTLDELRRTGNWWTMTYVGPHLPATTLQPDTQDALYPDPELFHWDQIIWKERSPRLRAMMVLAKTDPLAAVRQGTADFSAQELDCFWTDFIPCVGQANPVDWDALPAFVNRLQERYGKTQLAVYEKVFARLSLILWAKLELHYLGQVAPTLEVESFFHMGLLAYTIIARGKQTVEDVLQNPASAAAIASEMTTPTGLFYVALFWLDVLKFHAIKFRLVDQFNTLSYAKGLPGFPESMPFLKAQFIDEDEALPTFARCVKDGEWLIVDQKRRWLIPALSK